MRIEYMQTIDGKTVSVYVPESQEDEDELVRLQEEWERQNPGKPATFEDFLHPG